MQLLLLRYSHRVCYRCAIARLPVLESKCANRAHSFDPLRMCFVHACYQAACYQAGQHRQHRAACYQAACYQAAWGNGSRGCAHSLWACTGRLDTLGCTAAREPCLAEEQHRPHALEGGKACDERCTPCCCLQAEGRLVAEGSTCLLYRGVWSPSRQHPERSEMQAALHFASRFVAGNKGHPAQPVQLRVASLISVRCLNSGQHAHRNGCHRHQVGQGMGTEVLPSPHSTVARHTQIEVPYPCSRD